MGRAKLYLGFTQEKTNIILDKTLIKKTIIFSTFNFLESSYETLKLSF